MMSVQRLPRVFKYRSMTLEDFDPTSSPEQIKEFYAQVYPELTQAVVEGPEISAEGEVYEFRTVYGTKGITIQDLACGTMPRESSYIVVSRQQAALMERVAKAVLAVGDDSPILPPSEELGIV